MDVRTPRGTSDILPDEARLWRHIESTAAQVMDVFGFGEIRTPIFEHTELFVRGVGETSDIVEKQMYTFMDRGERSLTLRPEGTAPVVRALVQHRLYGQSLPQKLWYIQPMFRYERPQLGRGRQFHQFGAEVIGSLDPACDTEIIAAGVEFYRRLGFDQYELLLNSIGCPTCRPSYREELLTYLRERIDGLCAVCQSRVERNPLRVLDCKEESCKQLTHDAPPISQHLCDECVDHFGTVQAMLRSLGIDFTVDERLVRGLDYYTKTVFELVTDSLGAQGTLLAGGRYDGLVAEIGGPSLPAVGFGAGLERAVAVLKAAGLADNATSGASADVFIVSMGETARVEAIKLATTLRQHDVATALDYSDAAVFKKSLKAQMKAAGRSQAALTLIMGDDELSRNVVTVRDMRTSVQTEIPLSEVVRHVMEALDREVGNE